MLICNAVLTDADGARPGDVRIENGVITAVGEGLSAGGDTVLDAGGRTLLPAFIDLHCHFRTPGFEYKEDIDSGSRAAARGGYTFVNCMANTRPVCSSAAIAQSIMLMSSLTVPVITLVTGEGSSGGALAISVANSLWMLENAVYSVLSPEGFAAILWKDGSRAADAAELMKLTAQELAACGVADRVIPEPEHGFTGDCTAFYRDLREQLIEEVELLSSRSGAALSSERYKKFRAIGDCRS